MKVEISEEEARFILAGLEKLPVKGVKRLSMIVTLFHKLGGRFKIDISKEEADALERNAFIGNQIVKPLSPIPDEIKAQQAKSLAQKNAAQERKQSVKVKKYTQGGITYEEEEI